jgi:formylglycine-generating enzyme required for sulfatase activity
VRNGPRWTHSRPILILRTEPEGPAVVLDWTAMYVDPCTDCATLTAPSGAALAALGDSTPVRVMRGGSFHFDASVLLPTYRNNDPASYRDWIVGLRCSRTP